MSFTIGEFKQKATLFITRGEAKKIKKFLGGGGYITHYDTMGTSKIKDVDTFYVIIYHDSLKDGVAKIIKKDDVEWEDVVSKNQLK